MTRLRGLGLTVCFNGSRLYVSPERLLNEALLDEIRSSKEALMLELHEELLGEAARVFPGSALEDEALFSRWRGVARQFFPALDTAERVYEGALALLAIGNLYLAAGQHANAARVTYLWRRLEAVR